MDLNKQNQLLHQEKLSGLAVFSEYAAITSCHFGHFAPAAPIAEKSLNIDD